MGTLDLEAIDRARAFDARAWQLWGKADPARVNKGEPEWHPLLCHMIDVVTCAERLLLDVRRDRLDSFAAALALPRDAVLPWLLFFVGLHDIGKATPPFQVKVPSRRDALTLLGLDFPVRDELHGTLSVPLATAALNALGVPAPLGRWISRAVGAHHGEFASLQHLQRGPEPQKGVLLRAFAGTARLWADLRASILAALADACGIDTTSARPSLPESVSARNGFIADLAGLTTVADWLGSNADVFGYVEPPATPADYLAHARARALRAVDSAGWRRAPVSPRRSFTELFGKAPWPLHEAVEELSPALDAPSLLVIEAPMGEGKTEAALAAYDALAARGATGLYFALPTQATSNQIFGRVERFLRVAFPFEVHGLHLVHGDAGLSDRYDALKARAFAVRAIGGLAGSAEGPVADAWFARGKRALLAPIAVGTIDQALLGVLAVRHGFLRLHGLAGKVVVIDEVHAYDTYTSELLDTLLSWLHALGATVVLLSATLPSARREALVRAFGATPAPQAPYPRITVACRGQATSQTFPARRPPVPVSLVWETRAALPARLAKALEGGGCAVWIVNTVRRAQQTYRDLCELRDRGIIASEVSIGLLHARFPFDARAAREKSAEEWFGPGEERRPRAAILIGTQVLEQSLDLDFDLMVTEVAPVDLVLQRAGRLHRHVRKSARPHAVRQPALWLIRPEDDERPEGPSFGTSAYVYAEAILLRSWLALRARAGITLPTDIESLIEAVYGNEVMAPSAEMATRLARLDFERAEGSRAESDQAHAVVLAPPDDDDPFRDLARLHDEEDPAVHRSLRAMTRLGDPSVEVIPVMDRDGRSVLAGAPEISIDLHSTAPPPRALVVAMARQSIGINRRGVVNALLREPVPRSFEACGHLRFHRVLWLDAAGATVVAGVPIRLDPNLGLVIGSLDDADQQPSLETPR